MKKGRRSDEIFIFHLTLIFWNKKKGYIHLILIFWNEKKGHIQKHNSNVLIAFGSTLARKAPDETENQRDRKEALPNSLDPHFLSRVAEERRAL